MFSLLLTDRAAATSARRRAFPCWPSALLTLLISVTPSRAQHIHIQTSFSVNAGWDVFWYDFDSGYFPAAAYSPILTSAMRLQIPARAGLTNALGLAGNPVWILPEIATPSAPSIGFGTQGGDLSGGQIRLRLASFSGPGDFALFSNGPFADARILIATRDGLGPEDCIVLNFPGGHTHLNLAFNRPGNYQLGWRGEGVLAATGQPTNSGVVVFNFRVAPPEGPRLMMDHGTSPGFLVVSVDSEPNLPLRIECSSGLAEWTPLTNLWSAASAALLSLTNTPGSLFLRASHPLP